MKTQNRQANAMKRVFSSMNLASRLAVVLLGILVFSLQSKCAAQGWDSPSNTQKEIKVLQDRRDADIKFIAELKEGNETLDKALDQKQDQLDKINERIKSTTDASRIATANAQKAIVASDMNRLKSRISENERAITKYEKDKAEVERQLVIITPKPKPKPDDDTIVPIPTQQKEPTVIKVTHVCKTGPNNPSHSDSVADWHYYEFKFNDGSTSEGGASNRNAALKGFGLTYKQLCKSILIYGEGNLNSTK